MEGMENMEDVDLEEQLPPPSPAPPNKLSRKPADYRVFATPVRALSLVVLMVGLLFAVHLLAHDLRTFVLLVAESLCIFFVMSCVAACERERGPRDDGTGAGIDPPPHGMGKVAEVAMWSFSMALTVTMTFWVATGLSLPAVAVLYSLSLLVVSTCFAVLLGG